MQQPVTERGVRWRNKEKGGGGGSKGLLVPSSAKRQ